MSRRSALAFGALFLAATSLRAEQLPVVGSHAWVPFPEKAAAPTASGDRMIGLLEAPLIFGVADAAAPLSRTHYLQEALILRDRPSPTAPVRLKLESPEQALVREGARGEPSLVVYEIAPGWFRVALKSLGSGWLPAHKGGRYRSFLELISGKTQPAYLTTGWDGRIWPDPRKLTVRRKFDDRRLHASGLSRGDVDVIGSRVFDKRLWLKVRLLGPGRCREGEGNFHAEPAHNQSYDFGGKAQPEVLETTWIPAYGPTGEPLVWFYARGC